MLLIDCGARKIEVHDDCIYIVEDEQRTLFENVDQLTDDEAKRLYMLAEQLK